MTSLVSFIWKSFSSSGSSSSSSALSNKPGIASKNFLDGLFKHSFTSLAASSHRKDDRAEAAKQILNKGAGWADQTDWRQFALMHCPEIIGHTSLEGGYLPRCLQSSANFLQSCAKEEGLFFKMNLSPEALQKCSRALDVTRDFYSLRLPESGEPTSSSALESGASSILQKVASSHASRQEPIYLPLGYRAGSQNQGHDLVLQCFEEGDDVVLTIFNLGNGAHNHPIIQYTATKEQKSYRSMPLRIPKSIFYGKMGHAAFCHLLRYLTDAPPPHLPIYDGNDVYDIFKQFFLFLKVDEQQISESFQDTNFAADEQVSGNCPQVATDMILTDVLIGTGLSSVERRKFFLNQQLYSLISAYWAYRNNPVCHPSARELLQEGIESFGASILALYREKQISETELLGAQAIVHEMKRLIKVPVVLSSVGSSSSSSSSSTSSIPSPPTISDLPTTFIVPPSLERASSTSASSSSFTVAPFSIEPPRFDFATFRGDLKIWIGHAQTLSPHDAFAYVSDCVRQLPIPKNNRPVVSKDGIEEERAIQPDLWDTFSPSAVTETLADFQKLLRAGLRVPSANLRSSGSKEFTEQFLTIYSVYAISDKLARLCNSETQLEGTTSPFLPYPFDFREGFTSLPLGNDNRRFTEIFEYFTGQRSLTDRGNQDHVIFPIGPILPVEEYTKDLLSDRSTPETVQGKNHLAYLTRLENRKAKGVFSSLVSLIPSLEKDRGSNFCSQWLDILPPSVRSLYYFVLLSHSLFSAPDRPFPQSIQFEQITTAGNVALKMRDPFDVPTETEKQYQNRIEVQQLLFYHPDGKPNLTNPIIDPRFEENGILPHSNQPFFRLSDYEKLTTNQSVCATLPHRSDWNISEADFRDLLYITRKANLSLNQVLQEFTSAEKTVLLDHPGVQKLLDASLFKPRFLLERLTHEPAPIHLLFRKFVSFHLEQFANHPAHFSAILFLLRTGINFESFTTDSERKKTLAAYRAKIEELALLPLTGSEHNELMLHKTYLETQREQEDPRELFQLLFQSRLNACDAPYSWLPNTLPRLLRDSAYRSQDQFKDPVSRSAICLAVCEALLQKNPIVKQLAQTQWTGNFPQFFCGDLGIDFFHGTITHRKFGILTPYIISDMEGESRRVKDMTRQYGNLFWVNGSGHATSLNGELTVQNGKFHQEMGVSHQLSASESDNAGQAFLCWYEYLPWTPYKQSNGEILIYDQKKQRPELRIIQKSKEWIYQKVDEQGTSLPVTLINLQKVHSSHPLYRYTVRFTYPDQILCFIRDHDKTIDHLHFYRLGVEFKNDGRGLLSQQFPGYYLIGDERDIPAKAQEQYRLIRQECNAFEAAFLLYHPEENRWKILFPNTPLTKKKGDFSREVLANELPNHFSRFTLFAFDFDPVERTLKSESDPANIYLSHLFKMQRDYKKAIRYLNKIRVSHFFDHQHFCELARFKEIKDSCADSIAFNLKLCLLLIRNQNLMLEKKFDPNQTIFPSHFHQELLSWGMRELKAYLRLGNQRIPESLRLKEGEIKALLLHFRESYSHLYFNDGRSWEQHWRQDYPVLDNLYLMLFHKDRTTTLTPLSQNLNLFPSNFHFLHLNSSYLPCSSILQNYQKFITGNMTKEEQISSELVPFSNRISSFAVDAHFPSLYTAAKRCKQGVLDPFDFTLQALLKSRKDVGEILFWVRHFPDHFPTLSLFDEKFLSNLVAAVNTLKNHPDAGHFLDQAKQRATFKIKPTVLTMPSLPGIPKSPLPPIPPCTKPHDLLGSLEPLEKRIHQIFNSPYKVRGGALLAEEAEQETLFLLQKDAAQILSFPRKDKSLCKFDASLPETLMKEVLLKNKLDYLKTHRPMLSAEQCQELCFCVREYFHTRALLKLQELGLYPPPYDFQQYPEISQFILKTEKLPRKDQFDVYTWAEHRLTAGGPTHLHYHFPAGGGKTDVMNLLFNLLAKKMGRIGVTCVPQGIYPIDKENLGFNLKKLDEDLGYLEIGMHMITRMSAQNLQFIYTQLMQYKAEGRALIVTRHTFDALFLIRELACQVRSADGAKLRWAQHILDFFKNETLLLCDESHQNADPLTRAIYGTGKFTSLSSEESGFLLQLMRPLLGIEKRFCEDGREVSLVSRLKAGLEGVPTAEELKMLRKTMTDYAFELIPEIPGNQKEEFLAYWNDAKAPKPALLKQWGTSSNAASQRLASLVALAGEFFLHLLGDLPKHRTGVDHDRSPYKHKRFDVPCRNKIASTAEYEDPYKACALTIKGTFHRGLSKDDVFYLIVEMIKQSADEQRKGYSAVGSPTNQRLQKWLEGSPLAGRSLYTLVINDPFHLGQLHDILRLHPGAIDYFLKEHSFPTIGKPSHQLTCTTTDVFNLFQKSLSYSATPRERLSYPRCISEFRAHPTFESDVERQFLHPKNGRTWIVDHPAKFFAEIPADKKELFETATVLIDPRGFFSASNEEIALQWMQANPTLEGVLYCQTQSSIHVDREEKICLHLKNGTKIEIPGSNLQKVLRERGLEKARIGTLYDPARTESTNIPQNPHATALFFFGSGLTKSHLIQALMRLRGFISMNQTVVPVFPRDLAPSIFQNPLFPAKEIFQWSAVNGNEQEEKRIILNALQEIAYVIAEPVRKAMEKLFQLECQKAESNMESVIAHYQKYAPALIETTPENAYAAFAEHEILLPTRNALEAYAQQLFQKFQRLSLSLSKYDFSYEEIQPLVQAIIADVEKRIREIPSGANRESAEIEHHTEIKSQVMRQQEEHAPRPAESLPEKGDYGKIALYMPEYLNSSRIPANRALDTHFLSENFYFKENHLITAKLIQTAEEEDQLLKPIQFFNILENNGQVWAEADTNEIVSTNLDALIRCPAEVKGLAHTAFLVDANGTLVQKGKGALTPDGSTVQTVLSSPWLQDLIIDAALLRGRIVNPHRLLERIRKTGWKSFETLWNKILKKLPNPNTAQIGRYEDLKQAFGLSTLLEGTNWQEQIQKPAADFYAKIKHVGWDVFEKFWKERPASRSSEEEKFYTQLAALRRQDLSSSVQVSQNLASSSSSSSTNGTGSRGSAAAAMTALRGQTFPSTHSLGTLPLAQIPQNLASSSSSSSSSNSRNHTYPSAAAAAMAALGGPTTKHPLEDLPLNQQIERPAEFYDKIKRVGWSSFLAFWKQKSGTLSPHIAQKAFAELSEFDRKDRDKASQ